MGHIDFDALALEVGQHLSERQPVLLVKLPHVFWLILFRLSNPLLLQFFFINIQTSVYDGFAVLDLTAPAPFQVYSDN